MNIRRISILLVAVLVVSLSLVGFNQAFGYGGSGSRPRRVANPVVAPSATVTPTISIVLNRALQQGQSGEDVLVLQSLLKRLGLMRPSIQPSKHFGVQTRAAVIKFQRYFGLKPYNGVVNPRTRLLLNLFATYLQ